MINEKMKKIWRVGILNGKVDEQELKSKYNTREECANYILLYEPLEDEKDFDDLEKAKKYFETLSRDINGFVKKYGLLGYYYIIQRVVLREIELYPRWEDDEEPNENENWEYWKPFD